jgi:hypothetical protein
MELVHQVFDPIFQIRPVRSYNGVDSVSSLLFVVRSGWEIIILGQSPEAFKRKFLGSVGRQLIILVHQQTCIN